MKYTTNIVIDDEDKICIPRIPYDHPHINIHCDTRIHNSPYIKHILESAQYLNPTAEMALYCHMIPDLHLLLPHVNELHIMLDSNQDFNDFLDFDNHLDINDTNDKKLHLYVTENISVDDCKPNDLPTIWTVHTYKNNLCKTKPAAITTA